MNEMKPEDNYELYLIHTKIKSDEDFYFLPKRDKALYLDLEEEFFMTHGRIFNGEDYQRFMENPFPEKPRIVWQGNEGGYEK